MLTYFVSSLFIGNVVSNVVSFISDFCVSLIKQVKKELNYLICLTLLLLAWMGVAPTFYKIFTDDAIRLWLDKTFDLFDNNLLLNIPVCTFLTYLWIKWSKNVWPDKQFYLWDFLFVVFAQFLFYYKSPFKYANIVWGVDYREFLFSLLIFSMYLHLILKRIDKIFFLILLSSCLLLSAYLENFHGKPTAYSICYWAVIVLTVVFYKIRSSAYNMRFNYWEELFSWGFIPNYNKDIHYQESLTTYAKSIISRLLYTDVKKESFSVGISGEWGSGKSSFLQLLKTEIGDQADIVEFNPWMCRTPEQLTNDFFSSLSNQLSKRYHLSRPIKNYVRNLNEISIPASNFFSIKLSNFTSEESLFERKRKLSEKLLELRKRVIVIIDDIDRLEREEVFEVLRLIRNTADLCNIIYLVAYDKDYVTSVLNEKHNVKDASVYMEKIFDIEIPLPIVTGERIWESLLFDLKSQLHDKKIELDFSPNEKQLILSILGTYRRAKRFTRLFSLNYSYLMGRSSLLEWRDMFWLDILQMHDKTIYNILSSDSDSLLKIKDNSLVFDSKINININKKTKEILEILWGGKSNHKINAYCIRNPESFYKYFTLQFQLSNEDIDNLIATNDFSTIEKIIEENGVDFDTLWNKLVIEKTIKTKIFDIQHMNAYINVVLSVCYHDNEFAIGRKIKILNQLRLLYSDKPETGNITSIIYNWILTKLQEDGNLIILSALVAEFAEAKLMDRFLVQELIQTIIHYYIDKGEFPEQDLLNYDSHINMIIRYLYLHTSECEYSGKERRQDAFEYIIKILSDKQKKFTIGREIQKIIEDKYNTFVILYEDKWNDNLGMLMKLCLDVPDVNSEPKENMETSNENHNHIEK